MESVSPRGIGPEAGGAEKRMKRKSPTTDALGQCAVPFKLAKERSKKQQVGGRRVNGRKEKGAGSRGSDPRCMSGYSSKESCPYARKRAGN